VCVLRQFGDVNGVHAEVPHQFRNFNGRQLSFCKDMTFFLFGDIFFQSRVDVAQSKESPRGDFLLFGFFRISSNFIFMKKWRWRT